MALNDVQFYTLTQVVKASGWDAGRAEFLRRFGDRVTPASVDARRGDAAVASDLPELSLHLDWREPRPGVRPRSHRVSGPYITIGMWMEMYYEKLRAP